jgi:hypothetical protein
MVLVGTSGWGPMQDRLILSGFYIADTAKAVARVFEAGTWLATVRDWTRADRATRGPFPQNPFTNHEGA